MIWTAANAGSEENARQLNRLRAIVLRSLAEATTMPHADAVGIAVALTFHMFYRGARVDSAAMAG